MNEIEKNLKRLDYEIRLVVSDLHLEQDQLTGVYAVMDKLKILSKHVPEYLVRPHDMHIFERDNTNNRYRSYSTRQVTYPDGTRPQASDHMDYDNLVNNYDFFPIDKEDLPEYEEKHQLYCDYIIWSTRPDGHGGIKGGTFNEFIKLKNK